MRGFGVLIGAAFGVLAASLSMAQAADEKVATTEANAAASKDDYYTRRAKSILEAEKSGADTPHPLAAPYPRMDVVVCEAGCTESSGAQIVFMRPKSESVEAGTATTETRQGMMQPTSGSDGPVSVDAGIDCVAGCYERTANFVPPEPEPVGAWNTTVAPSPIVRDKLSPIR